LAASRHRFDLRGSKRWKFIPPEIPQKLREQTRTNMNDLDSETLIFLDLSGGVLRS